MFKIEKESFKMGLLFSGVSFLTSEFWLLVIYWLFPDKFLGEVDSIIAMIIYQEPFELETFTWFYLIFLIIQVLFIAFALAWFIEIFGNKDRVAHYAKSRWIILGMILGIINGLSVLTDAHHYVNLIGLLILILSYWLLFKKFPSSHHHEINDAR